MTRLSAGILIGAAALIGTDWPVNALGQSPTAVADVLAAAEKYLAALDRDTPALFAEERSQQTQSQFNRRQEQRALRSNVLMFRDGNQPVWIRDVIEVNGTRVVSQPDRLMAIVNAPPNQPRAALLQILAQGASQQYGGVFRAVNEPGP